MSKLGLVKNIIKGGKEAAPFYSAADKAAMEMLRAKGTGKEFMTELKKVKGVKPVELEHRKLEQIEQMPKMTKEEFLAELEKRPPQQIEEKVLREPTQREIEDRAHDLAYQDAFDELRAEGVNRHEATDLAAEMADDRVNDYLDKAAEELADTSDVPYHGNYTIPGGQNYREILLKMPSFKGERKLKELEGMLRRVDPNTNPSRHQELTQQIDALRAEKAAMPEQFKGLTQHFGGEPGILASIRVSDRFVPDLKGPHNVKIVGGGGTSNKKFNTREEAQAFADVKNQGGYRTEITPLGNKKVLHVEEIQSDWHQQGRKQGYRTPEIEARRKELEELAAPYFESGRALPPELRAEIEALPPMTAVPDAPFKKNWHELAMKRMLNYAADNGYDKVAITPGSEQASRYDLSKHVDDITYDKNNDGTYIVSAHKDGKTIWNNRSADFGVIESTLGQDVAQKIKQGGDTGTIDNPDLKLGGEGMKGFYDKMLPDYLNTYGKKYGVQVTPYEIVTHPEKSTPQIAAPGIGHFPEPIVEPAKTASVHSFDITPEMREDIKGGTPLYQKIAAPVGAGTAGEELLNEEPKYAAGGIVGEEYDPDQSDGGLVVHDSAAFKRGGKVKISDNPDAMFLELQDKKLNRK